MNMSENQALRYRRLAFYADDISAINDTLNLFIKKSGARCAVLIDREGHCVAKQGILKDLDTASLAALVAGSFASTEQVAHLLGENSFAVLFHQGSERSIHITLVGDRTLQVAVFMSETKAGLIQVMTKELATKISGLLDDIANRTENEEAPSEEGLKEGFSEEMQSHLDDLFGDL